MHVGKKGYVVKASMPTIASTTFNINNAIIMFWQGRVKADYINGGRTDMA